MRYIIDNDGYMMDISFVNEIACDLGECTEYNGDVPDGYETIEEWYDEEIDKLNAWKIVDGNLVFDESKYKELQSKWQLEAEENACVSVKYVNDKVKANSLVYDDEFSSEIESSSLFLINNTKEAEIPKIIITPANFETKITNNISLKITNENMLKNKAVSNTIAGVSFEINEDKSITLYGTATEDIEFVLNGSNNNTNTLFFLKANQNYFKCGLNENVSLNLYNFDGTDLELIDSGSNGDLLFTENKYITYTSLKINKGTKFENITIFPMIQVGTYTSSAKYVECEENDIVTIDLQEHTFENDDSILITRENYVFNKHYFLCPSEELLPSEDLLPYDYISELLKGYITAQFSRENNTLIHCDKDVSIKVQYFTKDYLNNKFAEIKVREDEIELKAANTYATKTEVQTVESNFKVATDNILAEVSKKVGTEEYTAAQILLKINNDTSETQIKADKVSLEGKTINLTSDDIEISSNNFKVDKSGNVTCTNANLTGNVYLPNGGQVIGGNGLLTNLQFNSSGRYQNYDLLGFDAESDGQNVNYFKKDVSVEVDIPSNFTIKSAILTLYHTPVYWSYTNPNYEIDYVDGYSRNLKLYKASSDNDNYEFNMMYFSEPQIKGDFLGIDEIVNSFGSASYTPSNTSGSSIEAKTTIDIKDYINSSGKHKLIIRTNENIPTDTVTACAKTGMARAIVTVIGYMSF